MSSQDLEHILYTPNLHEITFHNVRYETLETFFTLLDEMFMGSDQNQPLRLLMYTDLEMPPVGYLLAQHQKLKDRYAKLALRVAVLHPPSVQALVISSLILMINNAINLRMFTVDQRDQAMTWLTR